MHPFIICFCALLGAGILDVYPVVLIEGCPSMTMMSFILILVFISMLIPCKKSVESEENPLGDDPVI